MSILFGHFSQVIVLENGRNNVQMFCTGKVSLVNIAFKNLKCSVSYKSYDNLLSFKER